MIRLPLESLVFMTLLRFRLYSVFELPKTYILKLEAVTHLKLSLCSGSVNSTRPTSNERKIRIEFFKNT